MQETATVAHTNTSGNSTPPVDTASTPSATLQGLSLAVRLLLGIVFLVAGAEKLGSLDTFAHAIANYKLLPLSTVNIAATLFVWAEITVGVLLLAGAAVRGAALVTGAMLIMFIVAILSAMARGLEIDCGCFAPSEGEATQVGWPKILEDVGLFAAALFLIYFPRSWYTLDALLRQEET